MVIASEFRHACFFFPAVEGEWLDIYKHGPYVEGETTQSHPYNWEYIIHPDNWEI